MSGSEPSRLGSAGVTTGVAGPSRAALRSPRLDDLSPDDQRRVGQGVAYLLLRPADWVHRRVEQIRFVDAESVRRQISVDFTLPALTTRPVAEMVQEVGPLVPLAMVRKGVLVRFSVWQEDGASVPMLTTDQHGRIASACLTSMASEVLGRNEQTLPSEIARALELIVALPAEPAGLLLEHMSDRPGKRRARKQGLRTVMERLFASGMLSEEGDRRLDLAAHADLLARIFHDPAFKALANEFAAGFVMLVRLAGASTRRRVIKFSYQEPLSPNRRREPFGRTIRQTLESVGWKSRRLDFDRIGVGRAESYHVEIKAPAQTEFVEARLTAYDPDTRELFPQVIQRTEITGGWVHLFQHGRTRSTVAAIRVRVRAQFGGLPLSAAGLACFTALILLVGDGRPSKLSTEASAALLLLGPTLLSAFLVRPGEHALATRLLTGMRFLLVVSGLSSFAAAGALAAKFPEPTLGTIWSVATITACAVAAILLVGFVFRPGAPRTQPVERLVRWALRRP